MSALFIILVGLMVTTFCKKPLISTRCIHGFMSKLIKKSWTDSSPHVVFITRFVVNPERVELIDETRRGTTQKIPDIHDNTSVNILSKYFSDNAAHCGEFGECLICDAIAQYKF